MISVIIPTLPKATLIDTLQSLKGQPFDELIIELGGRSPAEARNLGWKKAKGDILVFIDDDVVLSRNFIIEGMKGMSSVHYGQSKVVGGQSNAPEKFIGTAMWFQREALELVGGFDETFPFFNDDIDIDIRLQTAGRSRGYFETSLAFHQGQGSFEKLIEGNKVLQEKYPEQYENLKKEVR